MDTRIFEHIKSKQKLTLGLKYDTMTCLQEEVHSRKNIRLSICGILATPMSVLSFSSLREAFAAMQGAESAIEVTRDKFDERRLEIVLAYVDSGLIIRHVIYAPEEGDQTTLENQLKMLEFNWNQNRNR